VYVVATVAETHHYNNTISIIVALPQLSSSSSSSSSIAFNKKGKKTNTKLNTKHSNTVKQQLRQRFYGMQSKING